MRRLLICAGSFLLGMALVHTTEGQWVDAPSEENAPIYGPLLQTDDDDSAAPEPTPEPTPEPVRVEQAQQQVEAMVESASALEVLDAYLTDKAAVEKGTAPEGFELPPLDYYKGAEITIPLTAPPPTSE